MGVSRRRFLEVGTVVAASSAALQGATGAAAVTALGLSSIERENVLHHLSAEQLQPFVGSRFSVEVGLGAPLQVELAEIHSPCPQKNDDGARGESYALSFRMVRGVTVPQGTYVFEHKKLGRSALLVVPSDSKPTHYVAVINHRRRT